MKRGKKRKKDWICRSTKGIETFHNGVGGDREKKVEIICRFQMDLAADTHNNNFSLSLCLSFFFFFSSFFAFCLLSITISPLKKGGRLKEQVKIVFAAHLTVAVMHGALETPAPLPAHLIHLKNKKNKIIILINNDDIRSIQSLELSFSSS